MKERKGNESGIHVVGYVEDELKRIVFDLSKTHAERVMAEAMLILLARTASKSIPTRPEGT